MLLIWTQKLYFYFLGKADRRKIAKFSSLDFTFHLIQEFSVKYNSFDPRFQAISKALETLTDIACFSTKCKHHKLNAPENLTQNLSSNNYIISKMRGFMYILKVTVFLYFR